MNKIKLKKAELKDSHFIASGHKASFEDGMLRLFDVKDLANYFYKPILENKYFDCLKIIYENKFAGVIIIKLNCETKTYINYIKLIFPMMRILLNHPLIIFRAFSILKREKKLKKHIDTTLYSEIFIFYILEEFQNLGIGSQALTEFLKIEKYQNLIVETTSSTAYHLYTKKGFRQLNLVNWLGLQKSFLLTFNKIL